MRFPFLTLSFVIIATIGFIGLNYEHEQVHIQIFRYEGINATLENPFKTFPSWQTIADKPCPTESCQLANYMNEVVEYQAMPFYFLILVGFTYIIMLIELNYLKKEDEICEIQT